MLAEYRTGVITSTDGAVNPGRVDKTGALVATDAHGRYQEAVARGSVFTASMTAVGALSLNSTTATGLILSNPLNSGKNLVLLEVLVGLASLPAGQASLILTGSNNPQLAATVHTTPLVIANALWGGPANSIAKADSSATLPLATIARVIPGGPAATVATSTAFPPYIKDEVSGILTLAPGTSISLQALTTAISVLASMTWEEVPV